MTRQATRTRESQSSSERLQEAVSKGIWSCLRLGHSGTPVNTAYAGKGPPSACSSICPARQSDPSTKQLVPLRLAMLPLPGHPEPVAYFILGFALHFTLDSLSFSVINQIFPGELQHQACKPSCSAASAAWRLTSSR